jgi:uncharacterized membrane protein
MPATVNADELVGRYLRRLRHEARALPRRERAELLSQIEEHLREAVPPGAGEAEVRMVLDRLGDPEDIVSEEVERLGLPDRNAGGVEVFTVVLLFAGGFLIGIGWIVGAVLLWSSRAWSVREKLIGTLVVPGGLAASVLFGLSLSITVGQECTRIRGVTRCSGGISTLHQIGLIALLALLILTPIATAVFLLRRARAQPRRALALH